MGTRSLTHIKERGQTLVTIYQQYDGYPTGVGADLKRIAGQTEIVNGYTPAMAAGTHANGMGCLAAQVVAALKTGLGGGYIYPPDSADCGEEFTYTLYARNGRVWMKAAAGRDFYDGPLADFDPEAAENALNEG